MYFHDILSVLKYAKYASLVSGSTKAMVKAVQCKIELY